MTICIYYLLDGTMMNGVDTHLPSSLPSPAWLYSLYNGKERAPLGPHLIDVQAAKDAGQEEDAHVLCRALPSGLHLSVLHSVLTAEEMLKHLHQFTQIWVETREALFLRFADCRVLPRLAAHLTPMQWKAFTAPMMRWEIHSRDGILMDLPFTDEAIKASPTPLNLSSEQIDALSLAAQPDQLIEELRELYGKLPGSQQQQHDWASDVLTVWRQLSGAQYDVLLTLARIAFDSEGGVLHATDLLAILEGCDAEQADSVLTSALKHPVSL